MNASNLVSVDHVDLSLGSGPGALVVVHAGNAKIFVSRRNCLTQLGHVVMKNPETRVSP